VTVLRPFEPPATPYGPGHRGVDLAAPAGTTVRASGPGIVSFAGVLAGRGVVAVIHGELRTTYEPLTVLVQVGQPVAAGTPLGLLDAGHAGCQPTVCLHWGLIRGQTYLSPLTLLLPTPPRLLPLRPASPQTITATATPRAAWS
jgi:murein DD-endopeptidase MepM/ murein hydrolase activator NlpD